MTEFEFLIDQLIRNGVCGLFAIGLAFCAWWVVSFVLPHPNPRKTGQYITKQEHVEADDAKDATKKAYKKLSRQEQRDVVRIYMKRDGSEDKH
jgi:hypothetical protein